MHNQSDTLVLFSGGLDSTVLAYHLAHEGKKCRLFYGDHRKLTAPFEAIAAKRVALSLGMPLEIVDLHGVGQLDTVYGMGENREELDVGALIGGRHGSPMRRDGQYVTGIHSLISLSVFAAQIMDLRTVAMAVTKEQADGFPTIVKAVDSLEAALELFNPNAGRTQITMPLVGKTKAEIIALGQQLGVPLDATWSCTDAFSPVQCGKCGQCKHRKDSFSKAGVPDKTVYSA